MKIFQKIGAGISVLPILLLPSAVLAATPPGLTNAGTALGQVGIGLGATGDTVAAPALPALIGKFIGVVLGVLGIVLVAYIVYAGYLWMTASGEAPKVEKAKKMIGQAIIGIVIIVAAYTISNFVIAQIITATAA